MSSTKSQQHKLSNIQLFVCINPLVLCEYSKVKTNLTEVISFCRIKYICCTKLIVFYFLLFFSQVFRYDDIPKMGCSCMQTGAEEGAVLACRWVQMGAEEGLCLQADGCRARSQVLFFSKPLC